MGQEQFDRLLQRFDRIEAIVARLAEQNVANQSGTVGGAAEVRRIEESALLKPKQAAKFLSISERTLWGLTQQGAIARVCIGRAVRYNYRDLESWVERQKMEETHKEVANG